VHTIPEEIGSGQINIATPTGLEDDARAPRERNPVLLANEDVMLDGKRHNFEIAYRPKTAASRELSEFLGQWAQASTRERQPARPIPFAGNGSTR
jgi:hypothetical protein